MHFNKIQKFLYTLILIFFVSACNVPAVNSSLAQAPITSPTIFDVIAKYREEIPLHMDQEKISGLAIAIVDDQHILWTEGFGYTDWDRHTPITPETRFSIQSMSKSFTATAVMFAAQDGLVDLDAPISTYLPDFHVNSIFEDHPEQKITLRMLLSHTAGFAHEAPYGGNYDHPAYSFEKHIASISDTWLKFPVGTFYSYSNLGIDLAGYILQVRSGMSFIQYVQEKVLQPLGMKNSTLDLNQVRADPARAIGHSSAPLQDPIDFLLIPSGGVWTSAEDMTHYLEFHINEGVVDGNRLLKEELAETMYTPPNTVGSLVGYALGVAVDTRNGARHFQHGGGGFGFNTNMVWYPDLKLGAVVLTNSDQEDSYCVQLSEGVLDSIIASDPQLYSQRSAGASHSAPAYPPHQDGPVLTNSALARLIESKAMPVSAETLNRWNSYIGKYVVLNYGFPGGTIEVSDQNNSLTYSFQDETNTLTEVQPGLFFSPYGDALDLRGPNPMFTNIHLIKANTQVLPFLIAFYVYCGLIFLSALFFWPARALIRNIHRKRAKVSGIVIKNNGWLVFASVLAALTSLFSLICLALVLITPNLVFIPWPLPWFDLPWWQYAFLSLPFASLFLAVGVALLIGLAIKNRAWGRSTRYYYLVLCLSLLAFNVVLLV